MPVCAFSWPFVGVKHDKERHTRWWRESKIAAALASLDSSENKRARSFPKQPNRRLPT